MSFDDSIPASSVSTPTPDQNSPVSALTPGDSSAPAPQFQTSAQSVFANGAQASGNAGANSQRTVSNAQPSQARFRITH